MMIERSVSVIIPSYNRAHLLWEILPSYFQHEVLEVIVINDCSKDKTNEVLQEIKQKYPQLIILENEKNSKQMFSKNRGLDIAKGKYIFFGDDDSYLLPDTIKQMLETKRKTGADIVGARIIYMDRNEHEFNQCIERHKTEGRFISKLSTLEFNFTAALSQPVECFYAQALILAEKNSIGDVRFDTRYTGNCYREETDFMLTLFLMGKKFVYDSQALLINLPPQKATGGARTSNKFKYHVESVVNNHRFLKKFNNEINKVTLSKYTIFHRQFMFISSKIMSFIRKKF
ncbi:glycosyltransferase [Enterobacter hormaechei]